MKTRMFLATLAALAMAAPAASAQSRARDHKEPAKTVAPAAGTPRAQRANERVPARAAAPRKNERVPARPAAKPGDDRRDRDRRDHRRDGDRDHRRDGDRDHRRDGDRDHRRDGDRDHRRGGDDRRDGDRPSRRDWRQGRVVVSSFSPQKGKGGTLVTIRGENFSSDTMVVYGGNDLKPTVLKPTKISFRIPKDARGNADIRLRSATTRRPVVVGNFDVSDFDAVAEQRRIEAERKRLAQQRWKDRQKDIAKTRKERLERLREREEKLRESRQERRAERLARIRAQFKAAFLADAETQAELALHAERVARLQRMLRLAEAGNEGKLVVRIEVTIDKENQRHERRMGTLESSFQIN